MLITQNMRRTRSGRHSKQGGVVLMMALIVLVAMTLAGIALVRSVDTSVVIAGNLAFKQAATNSGDIGIETGVGWLEANNSGSNLHAHIPAQGYAATRQDPQTGQTWDAFWNTVLVPAGQVITLAPDAAGNTVAYTIQRLCNQALAPTATGAGCEVSPSAGGAASSSKTAGTVQLLYNSQIYYRITSRIAGPRNSVSYVQAIVAL
jgi:type IV pilus assembly protein PilX